MWSRLLGGNGRRGADLSDLGNQFAALVGAGSVLQTLAESPHLALSLLPSTKITFWLSTHIFSFLLGTRDLAIGSAWLLSGRVRLRLVIVPQLAHPAQNGKRASRDISPSLQLHT